MQAAEHALQLVSVVAPAFNEVANVRTFYERVGAVLNGLPCRWELILVDDHSADGTFATIEDLARGDQRVMGYRLARNSGSHAAIMCGLERATGDAVVAMAVDLQDPPESLPDLLERWRDGAQVVWAVRHARPGESRRTVGLSRLYYLVMRRAVGLTSMPATGADFFLIDRRVVDTIKQFNEQNVSLMALITWLGFRQTEITYDKHARIHGRSGWSLEKKLKLAVDSIASFTYLPIRLMSYAGFATAFLGFLYAGWIVLNALLGHPVEGWSSLMVIVLLSSGIQMLMMGVLGEYLWRALDEARRRPRYVIEASTPSGTRQAG